MTAPNFCSGCGGALKPNAKFCPGCGRPVESKTAPLTAPAMAVPIRPAPIPAPPLAPPEPAGEQVIGVLAGALRRSGVLGLKMEPYVLVLTDRRIIMAAQTSQMMKDNIKRAREQAEQQGKGFFGKWGAQLSANSGQQYFQMAPAQILAEQPSNYFYLAGQIQSIRLREHSDDESTTTIYDFEIEYAGKKEKFQFNQMDMRRVRELVCRYYGNIVR